MLKVYVGVVRFPDDRDFVIMVDGEPGPVEDSVRQVIEEIWGEGEMAIVDSPKRNVDDEQKRCANKDESSSVAQPKPVASWPTSIARSSWCAAFTRIIRPRSTWRA